MILPILASLLAVGGCSSGDFPSNIKWSGVTYFGSATPLRVEPTEVSELGTIESTNDGGVQGRTAFSLRGVDPGEAVVMPLAAGGYVMFKARPAASPSRELCRYFVDPGAAACP